MSVSYFYRNNWFQNPSLLLVTFQWFLFWCAYGRHRRKLNGAWKMAGLDAGEMVQRCQPTTYKCHRSSFLLFCQKLPLASGLTVCSNQDQAFDYQQKTSMTSHPFVFLMVLPAMILEWHDTTKITIAITNSCSLKNAEKNISSQGL